MDLAKAILPEDVLVSGSYYHIHTGHSYWFRFSQVSSQDKIFLTDFDFMFVSDVPENRQEAIDQLYAFFYEKKEIPRTDGDSGERVLDYDIDADLIYSSILQCYGIDLYEKQYHWHKVRAMIAGLTGTRLNDVIEYRSAKDSRNKELQRMKQIWKLPEIVTVEDKEALEKFNAQFE